MLKQISELRKIIQLCKRQSSNLFLKANTFDVNNSNLQLDFVNSAYRNVVVQAISPAVKCESYKKVYSFSV